MQFKTYSAIIIYVHEQKLNKASGAFSVNSGRKVKGKQVKILHDLVTVIAERYTIIATEKSGRVYITLKHKSGNLPLCWYKTVKVEVTRY